ncbi:MAGUK p55 subfamily member 3 [Liparis tanakae]|uniref:MAGUK p55 subfamily member 3 n=1 Tax=Liparis tanakae TaxID=230148 RepID=A0A4Z2HK48_9TELE|nr:MAGUK p55 subfamily member 3 [Liparis tanakae]
MNGTGLHETLALLTSQLLPDARHREDLASLREAWSDKSLSHLMKVPQGEGEGEGLLEIHDKLKQYEKHRPAPVLHSATCLSEDLAEELQNGPLEDDERELLLLLSTPHLKAVLSAHDTVAQKNFDPVLPPLPEDVDDDLEEESVKIVRLVKNKEPLVSAASEEELFLLFLLFLLFSSCWSKVSQSSELKGNAARFSLSMSPIAILSHRSETTCAADSLCRFPQGATIRRDEVTGAVIVARIMRGGAADRSVIDWPYLNLQGSNFLLVGCGGQEAVHLALQRIVHLHPQGLHDAGSRLRVHAQQASQPRVQFVLRGLRKEHWSKESRGLKKKTCTPVIPTEAYDYQREEVHVGLGLRDQVSDLKSQRQRVNTKGTQPTVNTLNPSKASQGLLLLLLLMQMKEPFPRGVHAWRSHALPHGHVPTTIRRTRQLTPH